MDYTDDEKQGRFGDTSVARLEELARGEHVAAAWYAIARLGVLERRESREAFEALLRLTDQPPERVTDGSTFHDVTFDKHLLYQLLFARFANEGRGREMLSRFSTQQIYEFFCLIEAGAGLFSLKQENY